MRWLASGLRAAILISLLIVGSWTHLRAQQPALEGYDFMPGAFQPSGQPIIPVFEGWYQKADGSFDLCFGYWSGNTEQGVDIPVGPDNFIDPPQYDGVQPTHFRPRPNTGWRRPYCVFAVNVPETFGDQELTWTLRVQGETYTSVGHLRTPSYMLDEPVAPARASSIEDVPWDSNAGYGSWQGSEAPIVEFLQPPGARGVGRSGITARGQTVQVGEPMTMRVRVGAPDGRNARWWVGWYKYSGPGEVRISQQEMEADPTTDYLATTTATFDEPGDYVIIVQAIESIQSFERFCCWTNGYVEVTVTP